ncbi:hypothetical protein [Micromonospora sp. SH-82]|uniref:hypothetical protein n=1 Tax=Micromonospora sp. SH-82 TaxID=3132938 RepID=UPI003EB70026
MQDQPPPSWRTPLPLAADWSLVLVGAAAQLYFTWLSLTDGTVWTFAGAMFAGAPAAWWVARRRGFDRDQRRRLWASVPLAVFRVLFVRPEPQLPPLRVEPRFTPPPQTPSGSGGA